MVSPSASSAVASSWTPRALASSTPSGIELDDPVHSGRLGLHDRDRRQRVEPLEGHPCVAVVEHDELDVVARRLARRRPTRRTRRPRPVPPPRPGRRTARWRSSRPPSAAGTASGRPARHSRAAARPARRRPTSASRSPAPARSRRRSRRRRAGCPGCAGRPATACTAAYGGTRTSTDLPGRPHAQHRQEVLDQQPRLVVGARVGRQRLRRPPPATAGRSRAGTRQPRTRHVPRARAGAPRAPRRCGPSSRFWPLHPPPLDEVVDLAGELLRLGLGEAERACVLTATMASFCRSGGRRGRSAAWASAVHCLRNTVTAALPPVLLGELLEVDAQPALVRRPARPGRDRRGRARAPRRPGRTSPAGAGGSSPGWPGCSGARRRRPRASGRPRPSPRGSGCAWDGRCPRSIRGSESFGSSRGGTATA